MDPQKRAQGVFDEDGRGGGGGDGGGGVEAGDGDVGVVAELPDALTEKILRAVPFPEVCKARVLSKEWCAKFPAFINSVPKYCPVFIRKNKILGYDRVGEKWHLMKLRSLNETAGNRESWNFSLDGVLLCAMDNTVFKPNATVVNLVTGKSRKIKCPLDFYASHNPIFSPLVVSTGTESYQICFYTVVEHMFAEDTLHTLLYDSSSRKWSGTEIVGDFRTQGAFMAYLDGKFYHTWTNFMRSQVGLLQATIENGELKKSSIFEAEEACVAESLVVRCGARIVFVVTILSRTTEDFIGAIIFQLETQSLELVELSKSPSTVCFDSSGFQVASDRDSVYICQHDHVFSYHIESNSWRSHDPLPDLYYRFFLKSLCGALDPGVNMTVVP